VLRPTTPLTRAAAPPPTTPRWFGPDRILPGLSRTSGGAETVGGLELVSNAAVPKGIGLLDAPDVDSVVTTNRELARQLLTRRTCGSS
jgi:hypothetical protein